jgi:hypothetical protein
MNGDVLWVPSPRSESGVSLADRIRLDRLLIDFD